MRANKPVFIQNQNKISVFISSVPKPNRTSYIQKTQICPFDGDFQIVFSRLSAIFEVNTDLQKNILSKITAELSWPSILSSPRHLKFPLTNTNCSSVSIQSDISLWKYFIGL